MRNARRHPCQSTSFLPAVIQRLGVNRLDRASIIPVKHRGNGLARRHFKADRLLPLPPQQVRQFGKGSKGKHSPLIVLGHSWLKTGHPCPEIDLLPSECQNFTGNTPARQIGKCDRSLKGVRQVGPHRFKVGPLKESGSHILDGNLREGRAHHFPCPFR